MTHLSHLCVCQCPAESCIAPYGLWGRCIQYGLNWERFEAGPGCAAREGGAKETHVISVGKASNKQVWDICLLVFVQLVSKRHIWVSCLQVTVGVKTFDHLSAHQPAGDSGAELPAYCAWVLENEGLSHNINVLVQVCDVAYRPTLTHWSDCLI